MKVELLRNQKQFENDKGEVINYWAYSLKIENLEVNIQIDKKKKEVVNYLWK